MKSGEINFAPYKLSLNSAFQNSRYSIPERLGFILKFEDENGINFFGDICPLPGFSIENLDETQRQLHYLLNKNPLELPDFSPEAFLNFLEPLDLVPSVRFGMEQVLMSAYYHYNRDAIGYSGIKKIDVNAVLGLESKETIIQSIKKYTNDGFKTFKLKIGRKDFSDDLSLVNEVRDKFGNEIKLRLDVNSAWNVSHAARNISELAAFNIEYIEDPCPGIDNLNELSSSAGIPVAADEAVKSISDIRRIQNDGTIPFIIVKPVITGSVIELLDLIKTPGPNKSKMIISSAFESTIGKSMLVLLAASIDHESAHGLNTSVFFDKNICSDPYPVIDGQISFNFGSFPPMLKPGKLFES